jgi:hypothetical protein
MKILAALEKLTVDFWRRAARDRGSFTALLVIKRNKLSRQQKASL